MVAISSRKRVPPSASSNRPRRCRLRSGEGSFFVAEELRVQEPFREGPAVHPDERAVLSGGPRVDGPGHQFLPGPGLPVDHDGGVALGHPLDPPEHVLHLLGVPDDLPVPGFRLFLAGRCSPPGGPRSPFSGEAAPPGRPGGGRSSPRTLPKKRVW